MDGSPHSWLRFDATILGTSRCRRVGAVHSINRDQGEIKAECPPMSAYAPIATELVRIAKCRDGPFTSFAARRNSIGVFRRLRRTTLWHSMPGAGTVHHIKRRRIACGSLKNKEAAN